MYLSKLSLADYRNYRSEEVSFHPRLNLLLGKNAQGKTNVLEAIHLLTRGRSHRGATDGDLVRWDAEGCRLCGEIIRNGRCHQVEMRINGHGKEFGVDGSAAEKRRDPLDRFSAVIFSPEDLELVRSGPEHRRDFLDGITAQLLPRQKVYRIQYYRVLRQRNHLLKEGGADRRLVEPWDHQLAKFGSRLLEGRRMALGRLLPIASEAYARISQTDGLLSGVYRESLGEGIDGEEAYLAALMAGWEEDRRMAVTLRGPHRDEIPFFLDGQEMRRYASQGQIRTAALALKLGELNLLSQELDEDPILLLDDVMSELDEDRRAFLLELVQGPFQTVVTATDPGYFAPHLLEEASIFRVDGNRCLPWSA